MAYTDEEKRVITHLRTEASEVKQCFATFYFQAVALSSAVLALSFGAMEKFPYAAYAPLPVILLLMSISRVGIHKFSTANRHYGYELHLSRTAKPVYSPRDGNAPFWKPAMRLVPWEEALRVWRILQPTLYRKIYVTPQSDKWARRFEQHSILSWLNAIHSGLYKYSGDTKDVLKEFKEGVPNQENQLQHPKRYPWFMPPVLADRQGAACYTGSYLRDMTRTLALTQGLLLLPISIVAIQNPWSLQTIIIALVTTAITLRHFRVNRSLTILEDELLSIHSCAIIWQAVAFAHHAALEVSHGYYDHYTERLAIIANKLAEEYAYNIHEWLQADREMVASWFPVPYNR